MDQIWSLISFAEGLLRSSLVVLSLMLGGLSSAFPFLELKAPAPTQLVVSTTTTPVASTTTVTATTTTKVATTTQKTAIKKPVEAARPVTMPAVPKAPTTPIISAEEVNTRARASIVNILCSAYGGGGVRSISGSGVIVDSRGVILTNAHIAQYLLLRDYPSKAAVDCVVRTGSPASALYRAELLYLPPAWIAANASQIKAEHGTGTGEHDYAFLLITSTTNPAGTLPSSFPNIAMTASAPDTGDGALVAGYPAGFLDGQTIERNLYATSAFTTIGQLYTFNDPSHIDVVSLGGTVVSQGGSSGGAVVRTYDGKLTGLIATATAGTTTASRDLRAITVAYINRSLAASGKVGLAEFLSTDLKGTVSDFASTTFIEEKKKLVEALGG